MVSDLAERARAASFSFEIILVLDSREIETYRVTSDVKAQFEEVKRIVLSKNVGQQAATVAGIIESVGDIVVTLDDDYQQKPADCILLSERLINEPEIDLIYGVPNRPHQGFARRVSGSVFRKTMSLSGLGFFHFFSPLRAFRGAFREVFLNAHGPHIVVDVALGWVVQAVRGQTCDFQKREDGRSGYRRGARLRLAVSFFTAHSTAPLQLGIYLGIGGAVISLFSGAVILFQTLFDGIVVPGFAATVLTILFVGSIQLFLLGILGKYIGDQHRRGMGQPLYLVLARD
jgi:glycosyltransferase involved in cell wall biosynthesis